MEIEKAYELYLAGEVVDDPYEAAPDLEFVMYPEEADYEWRMVVLPVDGVGTDLSLDPTYGCSEQDERERFQRINEWMMEKGVTAALTQSPVIARMTDEFGLDLVDGRHRLALAYLHGVREVRMMVGAAPGWTPAPSALPSL